MISNPPTTPGPDVTIERGTPGATRYKVSDGDRDKPTYRYTMHPAEQSVQRTSFKDNPGIQGNREELANVSWTRERDFWPYGQPYPYMVRRWGGFERPIGLSAFGTSSIINTDCYISNSRRWTGQPGLSRPIIPAVGGLLGYPAFGGASSVRKRRHLALPSRRQVAWRKSCFPI